MGCYTVAPSALLSGSPVNIGFGATLWMNYSGYFSNSVGGWGPAVLDGFGNGFIVRASHGAGAIFNAINNVATGQALGLLAANHTDDGGYHTFGLGIQLLSSGPPNLYVLTVLIDGRPAGSVQISSIVNPQSLYPSFICDGGTAYLQTWGWNNDDGTPVGGWILNARPPGTPRPAPLGDGKHIWIVATGAASPIEIRDLYLQKTTTNQVAAHRDLLEQLAKAYL
jgi:hypothetical protein